MRGLPQSGSLRAWPGCRWLDPKPWRRRSGYAEQHQRQRFALAAYSAPIAHASISGKPNDVGMRVAQNRWREDIIRVRLVTFYLFINIAVQKDAAKNISKCRTEHSLQTVLENTCPEDAVGRGNTAKQHNCTEKCLGSAT